MKDLLLDLENNFRCSEDSIYSDFRKIKPENEDEISMNLKAELMAFSFKENCENKGIGWGTYFRPTYVWPNKEGVMCESPSIKQVNKEIIDYWITRIGETNNPVMKARYAGLVWDFTQPVLNVSPDYNIGITCVESLINMVSQRIPDSINELILKLNRALHLAISLNAPYLIERIKYEALQLENDMIKIEETRLCGFSFDLLFGNKKIKLTTEDEAQIIKTIEDRFEKLISQDYLDPQAAEVQAERLARFYKTKGDADKVNEVIRSLGRAYELKEGEGTAMQVSSTLQHLQKIYSDYGLKEEAKSVLIRIRELGPKINDELQTVSSSIKIPKEKIDSFISFMIEGGTNVVFQKIVHHFIPKKDQIKDRMFEMAKTAPLTYLITTSLHDSRGRVVATLGSLDDDIDGHLIHEIDQSLSFHNMFLRMLFKKLTEDNIIKVDDIISFIDNSPVFEESRFEIIRRGLKAYFDDDLLVAIHLLIPQIEEAIRNLIEISGGVVLKMPRTGSGFQLKTLDELLRDEIFLNVFGEDIQIYFRVLFTDQRGWNLRNDVCHGISDVNLFSYQVIERIIHALLILGTLRSK